jgi:phospholipid/cholesterol/gamma-HCH transport system permease protein
VSVAIANGSVDIVCSGSTIILKGDWTLKNISLLRKTFLALKIGQLSHVQLDASGIDQLDSAGALFLQRMLTHYKDSIGTVELLGLNTRYERLVQFVIDNNKSIEVFDSPYFISNWFYSVGVWIFASFSNFLDFFKFIGEVVYSFFYLLKNFHLFDVRSICAIVYDVLCKSLLLIAVVSACVGMILTYQFAIELNMFGAGYLSIEGTGVAILREFGPLLTACVISARCATGFAALIGVMKVNLEIDALETFGRDAICVLVIPRIIAMLIALPLLAVWFEVFSIIGSMFVAHFYLHVSTLAFLNTYSVSVPLYHYVLGMQKVPFFAFFIVIVGCYQGFKTPKTAEGIGNRTTKAAVQSIFILVLIDSFFSFLSRAILGY